MNHADLALLADVALGRPSADEEARRTAECHLSACPRCRDTLAALRRIVEAVRSTSPADRMTTPPESLWKAIAAELALGSGDLQSAPVPNRPARTRLDAHPAAGAGPEPQDGIR